MKISVVASGSNGNSCLVESKDTSILIDAGKSAREIEYRLNNLGKSLENVNGIVLSHAHSDHYQGIGPIVRKYNIPVYMRKVVYEQCKEKLGKVKVKHFSEDFKINDMLIRPIVTSHDTPSCGFVVGKFGLFTDTGIVTQQMKDILPKLNTVLLESNHDIDMLINGRYPAFLKQRILSNNGHLSNVCASSFIQKYGWHLNNVLLGHLSGNNTTPEVTKKTFETIVKKKINYSVLSRDEESETWDM
jgi:phosphoribosyl 1,2-cyclic phosphodiesterase